MKFYIETFGCTFNQADSQIMVGYLKKKGAECVRYIEEADVIILNTVMLNSPLNRRLPTIF